MASYHLSNLADEDLGNIATYSIQRFGINQARLYRDGLFKTFEMISDFPLKGSDQCKILVTLRIGFDKAFEQAEKLITSG